MAKNDASTGVRQAHAKGSETMKITVKYRSKPLDPSVLVQALTDELSKHAQKAIELYESSVGDWDEKPEFTAEDKSSGGNHSVNIYARGDMGIRYKYIDNGFMLKVALQEPYGPRSVPKVLKSQPGFGKVLRNKFGAIVMLKEPSLTTPREFTRLVAEGVREEFVKGIREVVSSHLGN